MATVKLQFLNAQDSKNFDLTNCFHVLQKHTDLCLNLSDHSPAFLSRADLIGTGDGIYADFQQLLTLRKPLLIKSADCCPIFYVSQLQERVAAIHAGWRGLASGIHLMPFEKKWLDPLHTEVVLGPCIDAKNYEVGEDVWSQFTEYVADAEVFSSHPFEATKRHFSMEKFLELEFEKFQIKKFRSEGISTFEDLNYFSFRRDCKPGQNNYSLLQMVL